MADESLNQRRSRGLSASNSSPCSKPSPSLHPPPSEVKQPKCKLDEDDDIPPFSGIADFDCPSSGETRPSVVKVEGRAFLRGDDDGDCKNRPTVHPSDSCAITGFNSLSLEEDKASKFKIKDRCRHPKRSSLFSASDPSESSITSLDATSRFRVGGGVESRVDEYDEENVLHNEPEAGNFGGTVSRIKNARKEQKKIETKRPSGKSLCVMSTFEVQESEEDDYCAVLSGKNTGEGAEKRRSTFRVKFDTSDKVDNVKDCSASGEENSFTLSGPTSTFKLPGEIANVLYPHQRDGLKWLWSLHRRGKGGILGDDMGLGKTMQICSFLAGLCHSGLIKRVLVVAPKTLLCHWIKELSAVRLSEKTREFFGTCTKRRQYELQYVLRFDIILYFLVGIGESKLRCSSHNLWYCPLCGNYYFLDRRSEDDITWDYMILDEGHLIKNPGTQSAESLLVIPCAHRIIISGTPLQNNLEQLWALFNFNCPGLLGDKTWFKESYETAILCGNNKNAPDRKKSIGSTVAKRQLYEAFLTSKLVLSAFDGSPLAAITILKKICDHPLLLTKRAAKDVLEGMDKMLSKEDLGVAEKLAMHIADVTQRDNSVQKYDDVSCKITFMLPLLASLVSKDYEFLRIDGTTKDCDRLKLVNDFQAGTGAPILLLTSKVGGLGLTLTKANRVIVIDPAWNPSTDNQCVDRAYRIGQRKDVVVYRLITCGTIEEKIYRKQIFKGGLFKIATEHKEQTRYFSQQDLKKLFSLPEQGFDVSPTQQLLHYEHGHQQKFDESLKAHIEFLETLGIAGVGRHSLLFSKTAPTPIALEEEEIKRIIFIGLMKLWNSFSTSSLEPIFDR